MAGYIAIGLVVLVFVLSFFVKRFKPWWIMPLLYLACMVYLIFSAITGEIRPYAAAFFVLVGIYGIVKSYKDSKATNK
jgi:C4-dicarboxylate transporter